MDTQLNFGRWKRYAQLVKCCIFWHIKKEKGLREVPHINFGGSCIYLYAAHMVVKK